MRVKKAKWIVAGFGIVLLGLLAFYGPTVAAFARQGFFDRLPDKAEYAATRESNLRAIHTALSLYHDSEERYPEANGWMDAIEGRLKTNDLKEGESEKKLRRPGVQEGFGYALNSEAAGKYKGDLGGDPETTVLAFESENLSRNASGAPDPQKPGFLGITVSGELVRTP